MNENILYNGLNILLNIPYGKEHITEYGPEEYNLILGELISP